MDALIKLEDALTEFLNEKKRELLASHSDSAVFTLEAIGPDIVSALETAISEVFPTEKYVAAKILTSISGEPALADAALDLKEILAHAPRSRREPRFSEGESENTCGTAESRFNEWLRQQDPADLKKRYSELQAALYSNSRE